MPTHLTFDVWGADLTSIVFGATAQSATCKERLGCAIFRPPEICRHGGSEPIAVIARLSQSGMLTFLATEPRFVDRKSRILQPPLGVRLQSDLTWIFGNEFDGVAVRVEGKNPAPPDPIERFNGVFPAELFIPGDD